MRSRIDNSTRSEKFDDNETAFPIPGFDYLSSGGEGLKVDPVSWLLQ